MNEKRQAEAFRRRFQLKPVNSSALRRALEELGYTIVLFNGLYDREPVAELLDALGLVERSRRSRCFTYRDNSFRLVFLHQDLTEEEQTVVLAHEAGHIWCGHMERGRVLGQDVTQEWEANEFSHYLLRDRSGKRRRRGLVLLLAALMLTISVCIGVLWKLHRDAAVYTDHFYRTASGSKYHLRQCMFIKDRRDVRRLSRKEFESGEYEACDACLPDLH